ncbi:MAG: hypothetical protein ABWY02_15815 [Telluria sp.]
MHIYSDISYQSYQHVNQMLHRCLRQRDVHSVFLDRVVIHQPGLRHGLSVCRRIAAKPRAPRLTTNTAGPYVTGIRRLVNLPSVCRAIDFANEHLIRFQLPATADTAVTFVPSAALNRTLMRYPDLVYYCVHDASKQSYHRRNLAYEQELVARTRLVFCDNATVLARLANGTSYIDLSNEVAPAPASKFFLVPPPIPDCFFTLNFKTPHKFFDGVYFGNIHDQVDQDELRRLAYAGLRLAIISERRLSFEHRSLTYFPVQVNPAELGRLIALSRSILLPYKNSEFMRTVSPAKIHQSIVTGLPVFASNRRLCSEYELLPMEALRCTADLKLFSTEDGKTHAHKATLERFRESFLLARIADLIVTPANPRAPRPQALTQNPALL